MAAYGPHLAAAGSGGRPARGPVALLTGLVLVFVLFVCGGTGLALYLINQPPAPVAQTSPIGSVGGSAPAPAGGTPVPARASDSAHPSPSGSPDNPAAIVKGQCVANDGTADVPKLRLTTCAPKTFLVVGRFDGTDDMRRCDSVPESTHSFYYRTDPLSLSFVLCLKQQ
jgi:hypothetical protein